MKKIIFLVLLMLCISPVFAYKSHTQDTDLSVVVSSNNASSCQVTYFDTPNSTVNLYSAMTKNGNDFNYTINRDYFLALGDYCVGITCTDGVNNESGSVCREVTPSGKNGVDNLVFTIFIIVAIYAITLMGYFGRSATVTLIGGMFMMALGIYLINGGIIVYRDWITNYFSYLTIFLGAIFSLESGFSLLE